MCGQCIRRVHTACTPWAAELWIAKEREWLDGMVSAPYGQALRNDLVQSVEVALGRQLGTRRGREPEIFAQVGGLVLVERSILVVVVRLEHVTEVAGRAKGIQPPISVAGVTLKPFNDGQGRKGPVGALPTVFGKAFRDEDVCVHVIDVPNVLDDANGDDAVDRVVEAQ